jgi:Co/Zn/Cd efflux system component
MVGCVHQHDAEALADGARRRTLHIVLWINAAMFAAEFGAGILADSRALIADSADNLGDALVFGLSLYVVGRSLRWRAGAAFFKGLIQLAFGVGIVISIVLGVLGEPEPIGLAIMAVATVALAANLTCFMLLLKHRGEDVNMRSVWLCARNDVIGNIAVIISGALVLLLDSHWPDIAVASLVAMVFLHTGYAVLRDSAYAWRTAAVLEREQRA